MKKATSLDKFNDIVEKVLGEFSLEKAVLNILKFYQNDKYYSYSEMIQTPKEIAKQLRNMDLKTDIYKLKSDGKTTYLDCIMPQLWDIKDASLEIISPKSEKQILAEHSKSMFMIPNRCKETPKDGLVGELILESDLDKKNAKGKFVLSFGFPGTAKPQIIEAGAAAMVSGFSESFGEIGDGVFWANGWTQSAGWYHTIDEPRLTTFMISYNKAKELEKLLNAGKKIKLKGKVDSKIFNGNLDAVSTVIPGVSKKEILLISHMYEPMPSDNEDGNATLLEFARSLTKLIKEKKIPKPKRSIRFLFTFEKYGAAHFFEDKARTKNVIAAINVDCLSLSPDFTGSPADNMLAPCSNPSLMDVCMIEKIDKHLGKLAHTNNRGTFSDDTFMGDPLINIPCFWVMPNIGANHHNSILKFEVSDWKYYSKMYYTVTDFALELAYLDENLFKEKYKIYMGNLNLLSKTEYKKLIKRSAKMGTEELKSNLKFIEEWNTNRIKHMERWGISSTVLNKMIKEQSLMDKNSAKQIIAAASGKNKDTKRPELEKLKTIIPRRLIIGMPFSLAKIPFDKRIKNPLETETLTNNTDKLFSWIDGKRDLKQCIELYEMDIERKLSKRELQITIGYLEYLADWNYFELIITGQKN